VKPQLQTSSVGVSARHPIGAQPPPQAQLAHKQVQIDGLLARAFFEYRRSDFKRARSMAQYLTTVYQVPEAYKIMAICAHKLGDEDAALQSYRQAIDITPDDLELRVGCGELCLGHHLFDEASKHLKRALELDPEARHPQGARARVLIAKAAAQAGA
jgi:Tfp pilus assembly protein PilF